VGWQFLLKNRIDLFQKSSARDAIIFENPQLHDRSFSGILSSRSDHF
jgi:hypothetical protein